MTKQDLALWSEKISLAFLILKVFCIARALYCVVFGFYTDAVFWAVIALASGAVMFSSHVLLPRLVKRSG